MRESLAMHDEATAYLAITRLQRAYADIASAVEEYVLGHSRAADDIIGWYRTSRP